MSRLATASRRNRFVILRTASSPPVAPHPASRRRSYLRLWSCDQPQNGLAPFRQNVLADALIRGLDPRIHPFSQRASFEDVGLPGRQVYAACTLSRSIHSRNHRRGEGGCLGARSRAGLFWRNRYPTYSVRPTFPLRSALPTAQSTACGTPLQARWMKWESPKQPSRYASVTTTARAARA